jgi:hypothetical protein
MTRPTAEPLDDVAGDERHDPATPALVSLITGQVNATSYRLARSSVEMVMQAIAGLNPVEAVDADALPDTDEWADTVTLALAATAGEATILVGDTAGTAEPEVPSV